MTDTIILPDKPAHMRPDFDYCMVEAPELTADPTAAQDIDWRLTYYSLEARRHESRNFRTADFAQVRATLEAEEDWQYLGHQDRRHYFQRCTYDHPLLQPDQIDQLSPTLNYLKARMSGTPSTSPQNASYHALSTWDLTFYNQAGQQHESRDFPFSAPAALIKQFESEGWEYIGEQQGHHYLQRPRAESGAST